MSRENEYNRKRRTQVNVQSDWNATDGDAFIKNKPSTKSHNELGGLQGGTTDQYYHITSAEATVVDNTSGTNTGDQTLEYMLPIWAEENSLLSNTAYQWAFGNGADTPSNAGITIYVPSGWTCTIVAMTATTNNSSGTSVIEADINGTLKGALCNVTISGRSGENSSFTPVSISSGDRLTFRTTTAGTNTPPSTACAWLRYVKT